MNQRTYRFAVLGAASLKGKELNEALSESPLAASEFILMDDEQALGQLEKVGDEVTFIRSIDIGELRGADFTFFAGKEDLTRQYWQDAAEAGSTVIDLSGALEDERGVLVAAPWVSMPVTPLGIETPAVVPAHPVALMLALILGRLASVAAVTYAAAAVLEPASEHGSAAMDELHQQTVSLLSFQGLPKAVFDSQIAFNILTATGEAAQVNLGAIEKRIRSHYKRISEGRLPEVSIQLAQAPLFHGYMLSLSVEMREAISVGSAIAALTGEHMDVMPAGESPSNLNAAGQSDVLVSIRSADDEDVPTRRFVLWAAADNLKIGAMNAVECALAMRKLRPFGQVQ